ncbi:hypothetical protein [Pimelobacter simplex]|uniref:hypothetical protein n=1 Tax=Nocardioides simplex TaxID=2045 RepID=UPI00214FA8F4|nr:hypothetical protein [Pimelobacter simplex]UUW87052.1 hypothetical protein M0M43_14990 [Pimelobacter simplex]
MPGPDLGVTDPSQREAQRGQRPPRAAGLRRPAVAGELVAVQVDRGGGVGVAVEHLDQAAQGPHPDRVDQQVELAGRDAALGHEVVDRGPEGVRVLEDLGTGGAGEVGELVVYCHARSVAQADPGRGRNGLLN